MDEDPHQRKKRGPYKRYLWDPTVSIPGSTLRSKWSKHQASSGGSIHQPGPSCGNHELSNNQDILLQPSSIDDSDDSDVPEETQDMHDTRADLPHTSEKTQEVDDTHYTESEDEDGFDQSKIPAIEKHKLNELLHKDFKCNKLEVLLMIFHLAYRHCNTKHFVEDQIKFVNALFGENVLDISYYLYQQIFQPSASMLRHYFCPDCEVYLGSQHDYPKDNKFIRCPECQSEIDVLSVDAVNYFITLSLREQIETILERSDVDIISRGANTSDELCDIFDGEIYKNCSKYGYPLANKNALTVTFNTDGVKVFKSTKNSLYPIFMHLNEIPPKDRFKTENLILGGLWFGKSAPNMALFLKPFIANLLELSERGVSYRKPDGSVQKCPVFATACSVDAVAKAKVLCMKQFNGYFGCLYCLHPNDSVIENENNGDGTTCRLHRHYDVSVTYPLRTQEQVIADMSEADNLQREDRLGNDSVNGFLGISILLMIVSKYLKSFSCSMFNIVWSVSIDYLHAILEGTTGDLLSLYETILTPEQLKTLSERILLITPPQAMSRRPRSLLDRVHWKAKEYRAFLLYYSLPCLEDLLPPGNFSNLKHFVSACHTLLSDKISATALSAAETSINSFVLGYQRLYGLKKVTYNLHLCTHLVDMVRKMGPLWCYSNFIFESGNGRLVRLIRGTRSVINEIAIKFLTLQSVSKIIENNHISQETLNFCNDLMCLQYSTSSKKYGDVLVTGLCSLVSVNNTESVLLQQHNVLVTNHKLKFFHRAIRRGITYCSKSYSKGKVFDDSCVMLKNGTYATIDKIVVSISGELFCIVRPIRIAPNDLIPDLKRCCFDFYADVQIVPFSYINRKCVFISISDKSYVCHVPNLYERD